MKVTRFLVISVAPCFAWSFTVGCGSGGGYRGATTTSESTGGSGVGAGAGGAGAGGMSAGDAGLSGAGGSAQGSQGGAMDAGSGGSAMSGQAGVAGMGGLAGAAGAAGVAGDPRAGSAGIATGGSGATGGAGAMSGSGGASGSAGSGGAAVTGGFGGFGATSGSGSGGATGPLKTCGERCTTSTDCRVFGFDQGYQCNQATHRCERFAEPCRSAVECIPDASFWIFTCRSDADCFFFSDDLCVDVGGTGRCARLAPSANGCMDPNPDEVTMPRFGASGNALVCANASRACDGGACVPGCRTNADCTPARNGSVCDTETRLCRCTSDQDCGGQGVSHCNTTSGRCECTDSRECEELPNANACYSGRCGCSGVAACGERTFSGTTVVCE